MIRFLDSIKKEDIAIVGGKGANLGEMFGTFPVPNGFVVTTKAYRNFLEIRKIKQDLMEKLDKIDVGNHEVLEKISKEVKKLILDEEIFEDLVKDITKALEKLEGKNFAVRSSATAEDLITASFAGQQDSYLDVERKDVVEAVKKCWASLYNPRAIYYRHEKKIGHDVEMAVVIQEMIPADFAGVMFTVDPIKKKFLLIEAAPGLGEQVVSGSITPSSFMLDRKTFEILEKNEQYELNLELIPAIGRIGMDIEKSYKRPQDIEFAVKDKKIHILQSRAITTL
ncbi:hypothetical protein GOV09_01985 [Candidatus Woesearchaeota archaeon]|nr:hypothetical protein [Candidatus Woesearchaeota archaeon]